MTEEPKSCENCIHLVMCKFKPEPYMGEASGGILLNSPYEEFRSKLFALYGENCADYKNNTRKTE